jgi:hypothetical protein
MRRIALMPVLVLVLLLGLAVPASAVTYGTPDGNAHPYVGLLVFYDEDGSATHRCSGTLISPTVVLTAGHCTFEAASARFYTESTMPSGYPYSGGTTGTPYTYPEYNDATFYTADAGVVVLDKRIRLDTYGQLADVGTVDELFATGGQQLLTIVGYGLQGIKPVFSAERTRYQGTVMLIENKSALTGSYSFKYSANPGKAHSGGGCFGDSGGPIFIEGTNTILGVNSYVLNSNCKGTGGAFRVDQQAVQDWIYSFL